MSTASAVPVIRPLPAWLKKRYWIAGVASLVLAPMAWLVRNAVSDFMFYRETRKVRSEQAYQAYIKWGWLHVSEARRELPRVALDQAKRQRKAGALRAFLSKYPASPLEDEARRALDDFYRSALESETASVAQEPLPLDELIGVLGRMDPARVNAGALARFVPEKPTGADCGKEWKARLPGEVTEVKSLLARALVRGRCDQFLPGLVGKDRALLQTYRPALEMELGTPAATTAATLRQIRDYGTVQANPSLFSPGTGGRMLEAIRRSTWQPDTLPDPDQIEAFRRAFSRDSALREAALDYMERHAAGWKSPAGNLQTDVAHRAHLNKLMELSRQVAGHGRPTLAAHLSRHPEAKFRAEVAAVAKGGPAAIVKFFGSDQANPLAGELADRLAASGQELFAYSFVSGGGGFEGAIQTLIASAAKGKQLLAVPCSGPGCGRIRQRVRIRVANSTNSYCYDKFFSGFGHCGNPGRRITVVFSYLKDDRPLGTDMVSAETPAVVTYYRTRNSIDMGPSTTDVQSATNQAMTARLGTAKLKLPF